MEKNYCKTIILQETKGKKTTTTVLEKDLSRISMPPRSKKGLSERQYHFRGICHPLKTRP